MVKQYHNRERGKALNTGILCRIGYFGLLRMSRTVEMYVKVSPGLYSTRTVSHTTPVSSEGIVAPNGYSIKIRTA